MNVAPGIQRILISDNNTIHGTSDLVFIGPEIVSLHCLVFRILWVCSIALCDVHLTSVIQERYFDLLLTKHTEGNKRYVFVSNVSLYALSCIC